MDRHQRVKHGGLYQEDLFGEQDTSTMNLVDRPPTAETTIGQHYNLDQEALSTETSQDFDALSDHQQNGGDE